MIVNVATDLSALFCLDANEGDDEPYLWTFFLKVDGDTVRQVGMGFIPSITVHSGGGSHGNLGATGVNANRRIAIPDQIGDHATTLRPIEVTIPGQDTLRIPGQYVVVAVLLEEDNSDDEGIENGHQSVRQLIELEANDFIGNLSGTEIRDAAQQRLNERGGQLRDHIEGIVLERFDALAGTIRGKARSAVTLELLAEHTPGFFWEGIDADEIIDARTLRFDERNLLTSFDGASRLIVEDLIERDDDDGIVSMYRLVGTVSSSFRAIPQDLRRSGSQLSSQPEGPFEHVFTEAHLCVEAGMATHWTRHNQVEEHVFLFQYPFLPPIWSIEGRDLNGDSGEVRLRKECTFPYFHLSGREQPAWRREEREVVVAFTRFRENGLDGIRLRNRPEDGTYHATLSLAATAHGFQRTHLLDAEFGFDGQSISSPFYAEFSACIEKFRSVAEGYAKSKRIGPRELWGPSARQRWLDLQLESARQLADAGRLSQDRLAVMEKVARKRLGLI